jgi:catechol 2,3-dioxygenase-like lactoylglutathione lyase family enzyme
MTSPPTEQVRALVRFGLNSPNALHLAEFYERAFGARVESRERQTERGFSRWAQVQGGAERTVMKFGNATLELLEFDYPGRNYPQDLSPYDTRFQHFGIVVADMQRAMERLNAIVGWTAISTEGPQTLPPSAGGVTAFKFRDPDGHPLEFLQFPKGKSPRHWKLDSGAGIFSGIDHSALSVRDVDRSMNFYQSLGLQMSARALNQGLEQQRLDGVPSPLVDVIALAPVVSTPHIEMLHYRTFSRWPPEDLAINDTAAARLILSSCEDEDAQQVRGKLIQDPDGHFLEVLERAER